MIWQSSVSIAEPTLNSEKGAYAFSRTRVAASISSCSECSINDISAVFFSVKFLTHEAAKELDTDPHLRAFGNDDVRVAFRRLDKLEVHRADRAFVLFERALERPAAVRMIASQPPHQADVIRRIDKYAYIK